jgi:hypothetical protein
MASAVSSGFGSGTEFLAFMLRLSEPDLGLCWDAAIYPGIGALRPDLPPAFAAAELLRLRSGGGDTGGSGLRLPLLRGVWHITSSRLPILVMKGQIIELILSSASVSTCMCFLGRWRIGQIIFRNRL